MPAHAVAASFSERPDEATKRSKPVGTRRRRAKATSPPAAKPIPTATATIHNPPAPIRNNPVTIKLKPTATEQAANTTEPIWGE